MRIEPDHSRSPWPHLFRDGRVTVDSSSKCVQFIRAHQLWQGMGAYRWLTKVGLFLAVLIGLRYLSVIFDSFGGSDPTSQLGFIGHASSALSETRSMIVGAMEGEAMKYLILVLIEVVIFHFVRRTLMIVTGDEIDTSFKTFWKAQRRMIGVVIFSYVMELVWKVIIGVVFWPFGLDTSKQVMLFLVSSFYLGFAIVDNYNEIYHMTIKQSAKYAWQYAGVTLIVGLIMYLLMYIPVVGPIIGPCFAAVIAALSLH
ncbi:MAG: hypothetical protein AAFR14_13410, partial [Bacteroidota bacterium]